MQGLTPEYCTAVECVYSGDLTNAELDVQVELVGDLPKAPSLNSQMQGVVRAGKCRPVTESC